MVKKQGEVRLFYSYAHKDEEYRETLEKHLSFLRRTGKIKEWHDRKIIPGGHVSREISKHLEEANIILLLVSIDFLNSDYCFEIEMNRALKKHKLKETIVIPVILKPCNWEEGPFSNLKVLPKDGKPITVWNNQDTAWLDVIKGIKSALQEVEDLETTRSENISEIDTKRAQSEELFTHFENAVREYIRWYENSYEAARKYVELYARNSQNNARGTLFDDVVQLLKSPNCAIAILGEFGTGKTTFARHFVYKMAVEWLKEPKFSRLPILLRLSDFDYGDVGSIEEWIINVLKNCKAKVKISQSDLKLLLENDKLILVFDGFDEMTFAPDVDEIRRNQREIGKLRWVGSPMIVTCRTTFFEAAAEEAVFKKFTRRYIEEMNEQQFIDCIRMALPDEWEKLDDLVKNQSEYLQELVKRPLFIDMLTKLDNSSLGKVTNVADLYSNLADKWIALQTYRRGATYNTRDRRTAIEELAYKMLLKGKNKLGARELEQTAEEILSQLTSVNVPKNEIVFRDMSNYSILKRVERDKFKFSHQSFSDFFIASKIARELEQRTTTSFRKRIFYEEIYEFLAEMFEKGNDYTNLTDILLSSKADTIARINAIPPLRKQQNINAIEPLITAHIQDHAPAVRFVCGYSAAILLDKHQKSFSNSKLKGIKKRIAEAYNKEANSLVRLRMAFLITNGKYQKFDELLPNYSFDSGSLEDISKVSHILQAFERVLKVNREHEFLIEESIRLLTVYCFLNDNESRNIEEYKKTLTGYIRIYGANHDKERIRRISMWSIDKLDLLSERNSDSISFKEIVEKGIGDARDEVKKIAKKIWNRFE